MATAPAPFPRANVKETIAKITGNKDTQAFLEHLTSISPLGSIDRSIGNTFYGINHMGTPSPVPTNKDYHGLTFFTRPLLNMSDSNLRSQRQFYRFLSQDSKSIPRIIRCTLDRDLQVMGDPQSKRIITSEFVDPQQIFIPMLTNNLKSISGWPDMRAESFKSKAGRENEVWGMIDSQVLDYSSFDVTANFRSMNGDPIVPLFAYWIMNASFTFQGTMMPKMEMIAEDCYDYNTRIYRLVLDQDKRYVTQISACGAAYPYAAPTGGQMDYSDESPINWSYQDQVSIPFTCFGYIAYDDILCREFNDAVSLFNPVLDDYDEFGRRKKTLSRLQSYTQVPHRHLNRFNYMGYPRIDPETYELQWWVSKQLFKDKGLEIKSFEYLNDPANTKKAFNTELVKAAIAKNN